MTDVRIVLKAIVGVGLNRFYEAVDEVIQERVDAGTYNDGDYDEQYTAAIVEAARRIVL